MWADDLYSMCGSYPLVPQRKWEFNFQLWFTGSEICYLMLEGSSNIAAQWACVTCVTASGKVAGSSWAEPLEIAQSLPSKGCGWKTAWENSGSSGLWGAGSPACHSATQCILQVLDAGAATLLPMSFMPRAVTSCPGSRPCKASPKVFQDWPVAGGEEGQEIRMKAIPLLMSKS